MCGAVVGILPERCRISKKQSSAWQQQLRTECNLSMQVISYCVQTSCNLHVCGLHNVPKIQVCSVAGPVQSMTMQQTKNEWYQQQQVPLAQIELQFLKNYHDELDTAGALVPANPAGDTCMGACSRNRSYCSGVTLRDAVQ